MYTYQHISKVPLIISPIHRETVNPSKIHIIYNLVYDFSYSYDIEISKDPFFRSLDGFCYDTKGSSCTFYSKFEEDTRYYIRTRSKKNNSLNRWSKPRIFYTGNNYPVVFIGEFV